ncbi:sugar ABC transporter substrate-binding protein [Actinocorallia sp. A-T 12471]|uniref:sugar ABC transporter substrate-binding protein n=1 Tax=Actinocorallia sp. A-T 12471 TaxID=3089813 RepID=UPI0029D40610|nr:substrate-binding domain-containing protein [Actinocorallia sp. A-T 12471]MDX6744149.1 substrate-binding domain-containing protein [Actinocorallia sp. A-T 12471]
MRYTVLRPLGILFAATASAALLAACGQAGGSDGGIKLGFVNGANTEFHTCLLKSIEHEAAAEGVELLSANSNQNPGTELSNIEDMIARQVDALIVQTVNVDALEGDIAKANRANIPIFLTSVVTDDASKILGAAVVDLKRVGALDAGWVAEDAKGAAVEVGVIAGAPGAASDLLTGGFEAALPANAKVVANQPGMFNRAKAQDVAENMIQAHPGLDYVFVANEEMAFGALNAFQSAKADVKIVTVNGSAPGIEAIKEGKFAATVANSPTTTGELAVRNTVTLLNKGTADKIAQVPIKLITKDNLQEAPAYCLE